MIGHEMDEDATQKPEAFAGTGQWTDVGGTELFWTERGAEHAGPPILFLHGIPTWSWLWRNVIAETGRAHRSIAVDLPGFGLSGKSSRHSFRVPELAETIERFLDGVFGEDQPAFLVAHDFGALVGAELVHRSPERYPGLVITNTSLRYRAWTGGGPLRILSVPYLGDLSMALARPWMLRLAMYPYVADPDARAPDRVAGYWYPFEKGFGYALARLFREGATEPDDFVRWRAALEHYPGASYVVWGARDPTFTTAEMTHVQALLSGSETLEFESASHFLPEERPEALGRAIGAFVSGIRP